MPDAPQTGLSILVDEKRVNDLLTQKSGAKAMIRSACNTCLFVLFLTLYTGLALGEPFGLYRTYEGYLRRRFDFNAGMNLRDVKSVENFWEYMNKSVVPGIYSNDTAKYYYPGAEVAKMLPIDETEGANVLLGSARLRMLKVNPNEDCEVAGAYEPFFTKCYGPFAVESEDTKEFGPVSATGEAEFVWYPGSGEDFAGSVAEYSSGGFMAALTSNYDTTMTTLRLMESNNWIGAPARVIFLDFTIYNFNQGLYGVCRIVFEVAPSGAWTNTFYIDVLEQRHLSALGMGTNAEWFMLIGEAVLVLFVLRYLMEECSEFLGCESRGPGKMKIPVVKTDYFTDAWNVLDWVNLLIIIATLVIRVMTWSKAREVYGVPMDPTKQTVLTFSDLSPVAANVRLIHNLVSFNAVLIWFKAVKYINIIPYITTFMQTVTMSQKMLLSFEILFCMCLFGFVLAYTVAFGEQLTDFRTPWRAFVFLMRTIVGDGDMTIVYNSAPFLGSLLIILFVLGMFFIIMNLFYAIMISALSDAKQTEDMKQGKKWEQTMDRFNETWKLIYEKFRLELRFRTFVPGLYSRLMNRKKNMEKLEKLRDEAVFNRQKKKTPDTLLALGPGNPGIGRRKKRPAATTAAIEDADSDDGSEVDLGPLRSKDQLTGTGEFYTGPADALPMLGDMGGSVDSSTSQGGDIGEPSQAAIDLVIEATSYVADGIVERTAGARDVLFREMTESMECLQGIGNVLEVLGRRSRDLEAQQRQLLKNF